MILSLGYDQGLYSIKSRSFMMSFHSNEKLKIKRNDTVGSYMHEWAWDLYMEQMLVEQRQGSRKENKNQCMMFTVAHPHINAISYAVWNGGHGSKDVKIDLRIS